MRRTFLATALCIAALVLPYIPVSASPLYETTSRYYITQSLSYEHTRQVTQNGFLDVFVMRVPLNDPNVSVSPVQSRLEYGLKQTTTTLLRDNGAIGGINGDFFGMSGGYSIPLGFEMKNGKITSAGNYSNYYKNESASLLLGESAFIDYVRFSVRFLANGEEYMQIESVNKTADGNYPTVFTRDVIESTASLDKRIKNLGKIVVNGGVITYISQKGEVVAVPENGYVIVYNGWYTDNYSPLFHVGDTAELIVTPSVDTSVITDAITGAGMILKDGRPVEGEGGVSVGRAPRTALGLSEDKGTLIMAVVDGRGRSVGATNAEMADIMRSNGASDAMHLDGGGSSTMAVTPYPTDTLVVLNDPSDGAERRVINALGVFIDANVGPVTQVVIKPESKNVIVNSAIKLDIFGVDAYFHRIELDPKKVALYTTDGSGTFSGFTFTPNRTGQINVFASYDKRVSASYTITSDRLALITPVTKSINVAVGESRVIELTGQGVDGFSLALGAKSVEYEVSPTELGVVSDGVFTAAALGQGWVRCFSGDSSAYVPVFVNRIPDLFDPLDGALPVQFASYPEGLKGTADYFGYGANNTGLRLEYTFERSGETQAAYAVFTPAVPIDDKAVGLRVSVYCANGPDYIRGRVIDAKGDLYTVDFTSALTNTGWRNMFAALPEKAVRPVTLERIYAATTQTYNAVKGSMYVENLCVLYERDLGLAEFVVPEGTAFRDVLLTDLAPQKGENAYDVTVFGALSYTGAEPFDFEEKRQATAAAATNGADASLYFGSADLTTLVSNKTFSNPAAFRALNANGLYNISLYTVNGGLFYTTKAQWGQIKPALEDIYTAPYVIVQSDVSPLRFSDKAEFELLHDLLAQTSKKGVKVFVVSQDSHRPPNEVTVKDGVRYVNLARLYDAGDINPDFRVLRIRVDGLDVRYSLEEV